MKFTLGLICYLLLMFIFSQNANANANADVGISASSCGMVDNGEGLVVEKQNSDICEDDVAFMAIYLVFGEALRAEPVNTLAGLFVDESVLDSEFVKFAEKKIGVSKYWHYLMIGLAWLIWSMAALVLTYKSVTIISHYNKNKTLEFAEEKSDAFHFLIYFSFLISLIIPFGALTFSQSVAPLLSLPAIKGGNYFYSTYIAMTNMAASDVSLEQDEVYQMSDSFSSSLVQTQLCQMRTQSAIMTLNAKSGTHFFDPQYYSSGIFGDDHDDVVERYSQCLGYGFELPDRDQYEFGTVKALFSSKTPSSNACLNTGFSYAKADLNYGTTKYVYDEQAYGHSHSCGSVVYNYTNAAVTLLDDEDFVDEVENIQDKYSAKEFFPSFKRIYKSDIKQILDSDSGDKSEKLNSLFQNIAKVSIYNRLKSEASLKSGTRPQVSYKHLAVAGSLLGSTRIFDDGWTPDMLQDAYSAVGSYYEAAYDVDLVSPEYRFGIEHLMGEAIYASEQLRGYQCAKYWEDHNDARRFIVAFNTADEDELEKLFTNRAVNFECVVFLPESKRGNSNFDRYVTYAASGDTATIFADVEYDKTTKSVGRLPLHQNELKNVLARLDAISKKHYLEAIVSKTVITGYASSVQQGVAMSIQDNLNTDQQMNSQDAPLRAKGFAMFSAALLYYSRNHISSKQIENNLQETVTATAVVPNDLYIEFKAFDDPDTSEDQIRNVFSNYDTGRMFVAGSMGLVSSSPVPLTEKEEEEGTIEMLYGVVENMFFSPVRHIKAASGMPLDDSLFSGFEACYNNGHENCISTSVHPLIAMSNFGHEMMDNMIDLYIAYAAIKVANKLLFDVDEKGQLSGLKDSKANGMWEKVKAKAEKSLRGAAKMVKSALRVVFVLVGTASFAAESILSALMPLVFILFAIGAFFAFFIPLMAVTYGMMSVLMFVVGVAVMQVSLPLYAIMKLATIEKSYKMGFQDFIQNYLGNFLTPSLYGLGCILSFSMMVVSLFLVNSVFALLFSISVGDQSSFITSLIFRALLYMVFFLILFVLCRYSLKMIITFPDMVKEKLKLKGNKEQDFTESLGFEQYVNLRVMQMMMQMPAETIDKILTKSGNKAWLKKKAEQENQAAKEQAEAKAQAEKTPPPAAGVGIDKHANVDRAAEEGYPEESGTPEQQAHSEQHSPSPPTSNYSNDNDNVEYEEYNPNKDKDL
jgi:conjugal transfer/type IV secretion protein DotA/TraY